MLVCAHIVPTYCHTCTDKHGGAECCTVQLPMVPLSCPCGMLFQDRAPNGAHQCASAGVLLAACVLPPDLVHVVTTKALLSPRLCCKQIRLVNTSKSQYYGQPISCCKRYCSFCIIIDMLQELRQTPIVTFVLIVTNCSWNHLPIGAILSTATCINFQCRWPNLLALPQVIWSPGPVLWAQFLAIEGSATISEARRADALLAGPK